MRKWRLTFLLVFVLTLSISEYKRDIFLSIVQIQSVHHMWLFLQRRALVFLSILSDNHVKFQMQLNVTTERKRERFRYFSSCSCRTQEYSGGKRLIITNGEQNKFYNNLTFCPAICKQTRHLIEDGSTDDISSISIFSSPFPIDIFWFFILEIIVTQNENV